MPVVQIPNVGITLNIPAGGSVPLAAIRANNGPLDGLEAGVPWDVVFVGQWRHLCFQNDATGTGTRTISVDGYPIGSVAASTTVIPTGSGIVIASGSAVTFSELLFWGSVLSASDILHLTTAQRIKWEIPSIQRSLVQDPRVGAMEVVNLAPFIPLPGPLALPTPLIWLDATDPTSLFADVAGTIPSPPGGLVQHWKSRTVGPNTNDIVIEGGGAVWRCAETDRINNRPVLFLPTVASASFGSPLFSTVTGVYTVVVVFIMGSTHPLRMGSSRNVSVRWTDSASKGILSPTTWTEAFGMDNPREMPAVALNAVSNGDVMLLAWSQGTTGTTTVRMNTLENGFQTFQTTQSIGNNWRNTVPKLGGTVCEFLMWSSELTSTQLETRVHPQGNGRASVHNTRQLSSQPLGSDPSTDGRGHRSPSQCGRCVRWQRCYVERKRPECHSKHQ